MMLKSWSNSYGLVDKHRHTSMGVLFTTCSIQMDWQIYEYAKLDSLIVSHSYFSCISDFVFTCGLIPEISLADFEMQSSCLATSHEFSMQSTRLWCGVPGLPVHNQSRRQQLYGMHGRPLVLQCCMSTLTEGYCMSLLYVSIEEDRLNLVPYIIVTLK